MDISSWYKEKTLAWNRLIEDLEIGYLDTDILDVLIEFFARPYSYTKSSCSGRIIVMDSEYPWIKQETNIVFKTHSKITQDVLVDLLEKPYVYRLWLRVQGPIYHVYTFSEKEALEILEIAREAGFKHSGILVFENEKNLLELRTGIEISIPLKDRERTYVQEQSIPSLIELVNKALAEAKQRNRRLKRTLERKRPPKLWDQIFSVEELKPFVKKSLLPYCQP